MNNFKGLVCLDIDATLIFQSPDLSLTNLASMLYPFEALPGVVEKVNHWYNNDIKIIIMTNRPHFLRYFTTSELKRLNIPYHELLMECSNGCRTMINNYHFDSGKIGADSKNVKPNSGLENINIEI